VLLHYYYAPCSCEVMEAMLASSIDYTIFCCEARQPDIGPEAPKRMHVTVADAPPVDKLDATGAARTFGSVFDLWRRHWICDQPNAGQASF
jgi:hypothetical protein